MWTKDAEKGLFISEKIRYASYVDKEAAMEKSSLSLLGKFNGTLNIQLVKGLRKKEQILRKNRSVWIRHWWEAFR